MKVSITCSVEEFENLREFFPQVEKAVITERKFFADKSSWAKSKEKRLKFVKENLNTSFERLESVFRRLCQKGYTLGMKTLKRDITRLELREEAERKLTTGGSNGTYSEVKLI